ncbi:nickel/cobalt transporter [cf. Phormidesmis sp. LEGE 11477]|uniref:nickel/cobalt transporter n=1 Tax=cf. Phormidesmis sp. LEGE 11477 TaxID=1828680 RepID=UPI001D13D641|nr:sulfite exporter TauE/SafE family protein [cf. Phormidesmis sp. LEGE 11477]
MPSAAHWDDLATAKITVQAASAQISLVYPGELTAFADDDDDGRLSGAEIAQHREALQIFFQDRILLTNERDQTAALTVQSRSESLEANGTVTGTIAPKTHTNLLLNYAWSEPFQHLTIDYHLFLPGAPKASCVATISHAGQLANHVFTPRKTTLALTPEGIAGSAASISGKWLLSLAGAFLWGALHSMSPGHGKTLVGAYLIGERATPLHAVFLAMTTTITHTLGVFALGFVTLFAARYILPEQLYPWLSLVSGSMVIVIGLNLLWQRWGRWRRSQRSTKASAIHSHSQPSHPQASHSHHHAHDHHEPDYHEHDHDHGQGHNHNHHLDHSHDHDHHHSHGEHSHDGHTHSHLPAAAGEPVTWRNLLLLGLSAGLVPCPAALVLLLGAIAIGDPFSGLVLVLIFSLGLSVVLTALGLMLVYAKQMFKQLPAPKRAIVEWVPTASACGIVVIGTGIFARSLLQIF